MTRKLTTLTAMRSRLTRIGLVAFTLVVVVASFAPMALAGGGNWGG